MDIHKNNYEEYVLDYLDENLSEKERLAMDRFFHSHPKIWNEVKDINHFTLSPSAVEYSGKQSLHKKELRTFSLLPTGIVAAIIGLLALGAFQFFSTTTSPVVEQSKSVASENTIPEKIDQHQSVIVNSERTKPVEQITDNTTESIQKTEEQKNSVHRQANAERQAPKTGNTQLAVTEMNNTSINETTEKVNTVPTLSVAIEPELPVQDLQQVSTVPETTVPKFTEVENNQNQTVDLVEKEKTPVRKDDGFEVESFPNESAFTASTGAENVKIEESSEHQKSILQSVFGLNEQQEEQIKKTLLPKSFGFNE